MAAGSVGLLQSILTAAAAHDASNGKATPTQPANPAPTSQNVAAAPQANQSSGFLQTLLANPGQAIQMAAAPDQSSVMDRLITKGPSDFFPAPSAPVARTGPKPAPTSRSASGWNPTPSAVPEPTVAPAPALGSNLSVAYQPGPSAPPTPSLAVPKLDSAMPSGPATPAPFVPTEIAPPPDYQEDPNVQHLFQTAQGLREKAMKLAPPSHPGISLVQALIGVAGALATQGNPHAQFVAQYLPSLGQAIERQYGNSEQAWQVARQDLMTMADASAKQAGALQEAGLKKYGIDVGYAGKLGSVEMANRGKLDVAKQNANGRTLVAQIAQGGRLAQDGIRLILNGNEADKAKGYDLIRKSAPAIANWTDDQIEQTLQAPNAKQILEAAQAKLAEAGANYKNVTAQPQADLLGARAGLLGAQTKTEDAKRQATVDLLKSKVGLTDAQTDHLVELVKEMPENQKLAVAKAQVVADNMASLANYRDGQLYLGTERVNTQRAANADHLLTVGMQTTSAQIDADKRRFGLLQLQYNAATDPAQKKAIDAQAQVIQNRINGLTDTYNQYKNGRGVLSSALPGAAPTAPTGTQPIQMPPQRPSGPPVQGPGLAGGGAVRPFSPSPDMVGPIGRPKPLGQGSNAANQANAQVIDASGKPPTMLVSIPGVGQVPRGDIISRVNELIKSGHMTKDAGVKRLALAGITVR